MDLGDFTRGRAADRTVVLEKPVEIVEKPRVLYLIRRSGFGLVDRSPGLSAMVDASDGLRLFRSADGLPPAATIERKRGRAAPRLLCYASKGGDTTAARTTDIDVTAQPGTAVPDGTSCKVAFGREQETTDRASAWDQCA